MLFSLALVACTSGGGSSDVSPSTTPTGVTATAGNSQVTISWNAVNGATAYNIYWSTSAGVTKTSGTKITNATSPYVHTGRTNGTAYYYVVTAEIAGAEGAESSQVSATPAISASSYPYIQQWGTSGSSNGQFTKIQGVAVDSLGNVYVVDSFSNNRIQKFTSLGAYTTQWAATDPMGVAVDSNGNVYVTEWTNHVIKKYSGTGTLLTQWGGLGVSYTGGSPGLFQDPDAIAIDSSDNVYVTDWGNGRVQKFTSGGAYSTQWGLPGSGNAQFNGPAGIAVDGAGNVFVADSGNQRIQKFSSTGAYINQWGSYGSGNGQFNFPTPIGIIGMTVDSGGNVYVADAGNSRVQVFSSAGAFIAKFGTNGFGNGNFYYGPYGIAIDGSGSIYAADQLNYRIEKFGP